MNQFSSVNRPCLHITFSKKKKKTLQYLVPWRNFIKLYLKEYMKGLRHKVYASSSCLQISSQIVAVYSLYSFPKEVEGLLSHTCHYLSGT